MSAARPRLLQLSSVCCRTSVKAAIVLQPLLGITNILQIVSTPYDVSKQ